MAQDGRRLAKYERLVYFIQVARSSEYVIYSPPPEEGPDSEEELDPREIALLEAEPRMRAISRLSDAYEMPMFDALEIEYASKIAERGWLVCGPAGSLLVHLLSEDTGLPIDSFSDDPTLECLRLEMYMVNPFDEPDKPPKMDHTKPLYQTGLGFSLSLDLVQGILWHGRQKGPGAMVVEWHYDELVNQDMRLYGLHALTSLESYYRRTGKWPNLSKGGSEGGTPENRKDIISILQSPQVFEDFAQTPSGETWHIAPWWGPRLARVRQHVRSQIPTEHAREILGDDFFVRR